MDFFFKLRLAMDRRQERSNNYGDATQNPEFSHRKIANPLQMLAMKGDNATCAPFIIVTILAELGRIVKYIFSGLIMRVSI